MDRAQIAAAVHEEGGMLRADGGDLILVELDAAAARIHLRLDLSGVSCLDCILPPDFLRQVIDDCLHRRIPGEFELVLDDPRIEYHGSTPPGVADPKGVTR